MATLRLGVVEPRAAIEAFQKRKLLEPSFRWEDVWQEEHARAFAVAGVMRMDVLQIFLDAMEQGVSGVSLREIRKTLVPQLIAKGFWGDVEIEDPKTGERRITRFDDRRLRLIYQVNLRQSRAAGQWAQIVRNKHISPLIIYRTRADERVRASHQPWHNLVLPVENPFWDTHFPPNGWGCRCVAYATSEKLLSKFSTPDAPIKREPPDIRYITYVNGRTGEVSAVARGIDPGFAYNPGKLRDAALHEQMLAKALDAVPLSAAVAVAQAQAAHPQMLVQSAQAFGKWVDELMVGSPLARSMMYVGIVKPEVIAALAAQQVNLVSAAIAVTDSDVRHTLRDSKKQSGSALGTDLYKQLPWLISRVQAVLFERGSKGLLDSLLYVIPVEGSSAKLVVQLNKSVKVNLDGKRQHLLANIVRTAKLMNTNALQDRNLYQLVWGAL